MKLHSIRLGHANNSSSTHSILLNASKDERGVDPAGDFAFGWEEFHLTKPTEKLRYLAALMHTAMANMPEEHRLAIIKDVLGISPKKSEGEDDDSIYVDHQSVPVFPRKFKSDFFHPDFITDLRNAVLGDDRVTICGGNDNSEREILTGGTELSWYEKLPKDYGSTANLIIGRKVDGIWTLYNKENGAKVRFSFDETPDKGYASRPELVDVKITDFCPFGCSFCYQDSTRAGSHADERFLDKIAYDCGVAEVFEVALGGGEPTLHPSFAKILATFAGYGVTPNFTSFSMAWAKKPEIVCAVKKHCRSFAISNPQAIPALRDWNNEEHGLTGVLQLAMGVYPKDETKSALIQARDFGIPITVLGYKHHGRGETFKKEEYSWVVDFLADPANHFFGFGADSVFVEQFRNELLACNVSEKLMVSEEGRYSCYIDAVSKQMGMCSYTKAMHPINEKYGLLFEHFPYLGRPRQELKETVRM